MKLKPNTARVLGFIAFIVIATVSLVLLTLASVAILGALPYYIGIPIVLATSIVGSYGVLSLASWAWVLIRSRAEDIE